MHPESGFWIAPVWPKIGTMTMTSQFSDKFGTNVSNKMLLNAAKWQDYSFSRFLVIKGKPRLGLSQVFPFLTIE